MKQSNLEKKGIDKRKEEVIRNDFNKGDQYSPTHRTALSDESSPENGLGKGVGSGGHGFSIPDPEKGPYMVDYSNFETQKGGGYYDINGRNDIGGRKKLSSISLYSKDNAYGDIDTTLNELEGQYIMK